MLKFSDEIKDLSAALAKAQGELENAAKNATNPHFRNNYADLATIINVVRPVMSKHGLALTQHPAFAEGMVHVTTLLSHSSGQWMQSCVSSPVGKVDAQGVGSAITYCRRYSLAAIAGISQEDDDGNAASRTAEKKEVKPPVKLDAKLCKMLDAAQTPEEWKATWNTIDVGLRHGYSEYMAAAKVKFGGDHA